LDDWEEQARAHEELNKYEDEDIQERIKEHQWQEDKNRRK
jgi:hypothetical protein